MHEENRCKAIQFQVLQTGKVLSNETEERDERNWRVDIQKRSPCESINEETNDNNSFPAYFSTATHTKPIYATEKMPKAP